MNITVTSLIVKHGGKSRVFMLYEKVEEQHERSVNIISYFYSLIELLRGYGITVSLCIRKYRHISQIEMVPRCSLWHFQDIPQVSVPFTTLLLPADSFANIWWVIIWFLNFRKINVHLMWTGFFPPRELSGLQICHKFYMFYLHNIAFHVIRMKNAVYYYVLTHSKANLLTC